jgi:hypothetical protein
LGKITIEKPSILGIKNEKRREERGRCLYVINLQG